MKEMEEKKQTTSMSENGLLFAVTTVVNWSISIYFCTFLNYLLKAKVFSNCILRIHQETEMKKKNFPSLLKNNKWNGSFIPFRKKFFPFLFNQ